MGKEVLKYSEGKMCDPLLVPVDWMSKGRGEGSEGIVTDCKWLLGWVDC